MYDKQWRKKTLARRFSCRCFDAFQMSKQAGRSMLNSCLKLVNIKATCDKTYLNLKSGVKEAATAGGNENLEVINFPVIFGRYIIYKHGQH